MPATKALPVRRIARSYGHHELNTRLENYFMDALKDVYWAEKHQVKSLPKLLKASTTVELRNVIEEHITQTEVHVERLEQVFEWMGKKSQGKKCGGMEGLLKEGDTVLEETEDGSMTRDSAIIIAVQKVEHYEIAAYGGLLQLAKTMGMDEVAAMMEQTLEEEKETDRILTAIAESGINWSAELEDSYMEGEE